MKFLNLITNVSVYVAIFATQMIGADVPCGSAYHGSDFYVASTIEAPRR